MEVSERIAANKVMQKENIEEKQSRLKWAVMLISPIFLIILTLFLGRYSIPPSQVVQILGNKFLGLNFEPTWTSSAETVILQVRLPRAIMAALVGASLSMSGAAFQGMFQNPLVSPFILGVSAGASFGAAAGLVLELPALGVQALAFIFGIIAVGIAYFLARIYKSTPILMLVLSGMVVSTFFQALLSMVKFIADDEEKLPAITFWLMGSLGSIEVKDLAIAVTPISLSMIILYLLRWKLNVLSMGDREARSLGVNNELIKTIIILSTTLITSTVVAFSGIIGWVGQVIPHFCRMIVGPDHKVLIPATMLIGAAYLILIDNFCRLITANEIPIGILTSIVGAPVFAYLLRKTKGGWN